LFRGPAAPGALGLAFVRALTVAEMSGEKQNPAGSGGVAKSKVKRLICADDRRRAVVAMVVVMRARKHQTHSI